MQDALEGFELTGPGLPVAVAQALHWSHELTGWLEKELPEAMADPGARRQDTAAVAFFSIALNHRDGVLVLASLDQRTSLMALARSMLEAYVRGLWYHHCATAAQVDQLLANRDPAAFESMSARLIKLGFPQVEAIKRHYKVLCDYSHGGGRQASRWIAMDRIAPQHRDEEVVEVLELVNFVGCLAARDLTFVAGHAPDLFQAKTFSVSAEIQARRNLKARPPVSAQAQPPSVSDSPAG
jgi:hypothetical protein